MKELKLLLLEKGDSQKNLVDKTNFNFSQILSFEGGPYGKVGPEGKTGNSGTQGPSGSFGPQGKRGNKWTVSDISPSGALNGDYWMNPNSNNEIRVYNTSTGVWDLYSININGLDIFREFGPLQTQSGISSKNGYFLSLPSPSLNTFVLSDSYLSSGSTTANPQYTKMVISTNSQIPGRRLLEFTKGPYHGTSFNGETPSFYWTSGPTSSNGNYGLGFLCPQILDLDLGGDLNLKSLSGGILLKSGDYSSGSFTMDSYINGPYYLNSYLGNLNINVDSGMRYLLFEAQNIGFSVPTSHNINTSTVLDVRTTGSTGSQPSLNLITNNFAVGNLYYKMDETYPSTRSGSTLFKATNSTTNILEISGKGDFKVDKIVYPLHPLEDPIEYVSGGFGLTWFSPSISSVPGGTGFNVSRGIDYYMVPTTSTAGILYLYTSATGQGWLDLIGENEYMDFRVHSSDPNKGFSVIGIDASPQVGQASFVGTFSQYCTSVEFTIINISKTSSGTSPTDRWFKVLAKAYGGNLSTPFCREFYTNGSTP